MSTVPVPVDRVKWIIDKLREDDDPGSRPIGQMHYNSDKRTVLWTSLPDDPKLNPTVNEVVAELIELLSTVEVE